MHVGFAIRKEEPGSLLDIIKRVHRQADRHRDVWIEKGYESRVQFMLDTINDLSSNRQRAAQQQLQQGGRRLRTWVQRLKTKDQRAHPPLRVGWNDLMASGHRGRWWIVGSSWVGRDQQSESSNSGVRTNKRDSESAVGVARNASSKMLALAQKHHMNTDTRKAIFCVLMSSTDYLEAFERLLKLGLKGPQKREICRVLLYVLLFERVTFITNTKIRTRTQQVLLRCLEAIQSIFRTRCEATVSVRSSHQVHASALFLGCLQIVR